MSRVFSDGFAEPILWGAREAYTIAEIAAGLELAEWVVAAVIESRSGVHFPRVAQIAEVSFKAPVRKPVPRLLSVPARVDPRRTDAAYVAWAKARSGATVLLGTG